jgi:hypothetical protein
MAPANLFEEMQLKVRSEAAMTRPAQGDQVVLCRWSSVAPWADVVDMQYDVNIIGWPLATESATVLIAGQDLHA